MDKFILPDPFVVEEEIPLEIAQDVTNYEVTAQAIAMVEEYSAMATMANRRVVMRLAWAPPLPRNVEKDGVSSVVGDSRGRMVTPLGYLIRATNISSSPLWWHVNTPYQEGDHDGQITARVADKSVEIKPGQVRVHSHGWGNGAHMFPLRGALEQQDAPGTFVTSVALADYFFIRDKYGETDNTIQKGHAMVRIEVSVRYHMDKADRLEVTRTEDKKSLFVGGSQ